MRYGFLLAGLAMVAACGAAPPAPPPAGPCTYEAACTALTAAGCPLGEEGDCAAYLTRVLGSARLANLATGAPLACADVAAVATAADAQRLGFTCRAP